MATLAEGVEAWHSQQSSQTTSPAGNLLFYQSQAQGAFLPSLQWAFQAASDPEQLEALGFVLDCPEALLASLTLEHCL
eukprot:10477738-Lingulodinium_polyedra.AAC.1